MRYRFCSCNDMKRVVLPEDGLKGEDIPLLCRLPEDLLCLVLFEWLVTADVVALDSGLCSHKLRQRISTCVRLYFPHNIAIHRDMTDPTEILRRAWLARRGASITTISCYPDIAESVVSRLALTSLVSLSLFTCWKISDECIGVICNNCFGLKELDLSDCWLITDAAMKTIGENLMNLTILKISGCRKITGSGFAPLGSNLRLVHFDMSFCVGVQDIGAIHLSGACAASLKDLNISYCTALSTRAIAILFTNCCSLKKLNMNGNTACGEEGLLSAAFAAPDLVELHACYCASAVTGQTISAISSCCLQLHTIEVADCPRISDESISAICCRCHSLRHISAPGCLLGDDAIASISILSSVLRHLDISGPCRSSTSVSFLMLSEMCVSLTYLNISGSPCCDDVVALLAMHCTNLLSLEMGSCQETSPKLFSGVKFRALQLLNVSSCLLTDGSVYDLCLACPNLVVLRVQGNIKLTDLAILRILQTYRQITELDLAWLPAITGNCLLPLLGDKRKSLKTLNLRGCSQLLEASNLAIKQLIIEYGDIIEVPSF